MYRRIRRAAGSADAVHVIFGIMWKREVDDIVHVFDVNTPAGHIRGHQHADLAGLELFQSADALLLRHFSRQNCAVDPIAVQRFRQSSGFIAPVAKDQHPLKILARDDVVGQGEFLIGGDDVDHLIHGVHGHLLRLDFD